MALLLLAVDANVANITRLDIGEEAIVVLLEHVAVVEVHLLL